MNRENNEAGFKNTQDAVEAIENGTFSSIAEYDANVIMTIFNKLNPLLRSKVANRSGASKGVWLYNTPMRKTNINDEYHFEREDIYMIFTSLKREKVDELWGYSKDRLDIYEELSKEFRFIFDDRVYMQNLTAYANAYMKEVLGVTV